MVGGRSLAVRRRNKVQLRHVGPESIRDSVAFAPKGFGTSVHPSRKCSGLRFLCPESVRDSVSSAPKGFGTPFPTSRGGRNSLAFARQCNFFSTFTPQTDSGVYRLFVPKRGRALTVSRPRILSRSAPVLSAFTSGWLVWSASKGDQHQRHFFKCLSNKPPTVRMNNSLSQRLPHLHRAGGSSGIRQCFRQDPAPKTPVSEPRALLL